MKFFLQLWQLIFYTPPQNLLIFMFFLITYFFNPNLWYPVEPLLNLLDNPADPTFSSRRGIGTSLIVSLETLSIRRIATLSDTTLKSFYILLKKD